MAELAKRAGGHSAECERGQRPRIVWTEKLYSQGVAGMGQRQLNLFELHWREPRNQLFDM